jgi:hypothetical protein
VREKLKRDAILLSFGLERNGRERLLLCGSHRFLVSSLNCEERGKKRDLIFCFQFYPLVITVYNTLLHYCSYAFVFFFSFNSSIFTTALSMCLSVVPPFYCNQSFKLFCFVLDELKTHLRSCFPISLKPWNFGSD